MASLANTRERRANAGARMAQMLDAEEEEFYKTTYGGFIEVKIKIKITFSFISNKILF